MARAKKSKKKTIKKKAAKKVAKKVTKKNVTKRPVVTAKSNNKGIELVQDLLTLVKAQTQAIDAIGLIVTEIKNEISGKKTFNKESEAKTFLAPGVINGDAPAQAIVANENQLDLFAEAPAPTNGKKQYTKEDVAQILQQLYTVGGHDAVKAVLDLYKATRVSEILETDYSAVYHSCETRLNLVGREPQESDNDATSMF